PSVRARSHLRSGGAAAPGALRVNATEQSTSTGPATGAGAIDPALRAILRCPDCRASLEDEEGGLRCGACQRAFPVQDGVPDLVGSMDAVNLGELATQDHVSELYEEARYHRPFAREFHRRNLLRMCELVRLDGRILDDGCGNGFFFDVVRDRVPTSAEL